MTRLASGMEIVARLSTQAANTIKDKVVMAGNGMSITPVHLTQMTDASITDSVCTSISRVRCPMCNVVL